MEETQVTVAAVRDVGPDAVALDLDTPDGFDAQPGQFVKLLIECDGKDQSRFYTISSPDMTDTFEMTISIDPDGEVSPYLRELGSGDEVTLSGPYGNAYYEGESSVCLLAGGPGVGPAVGIAERVLADGGDAAVIYRDEQPIHEDRLEELSENGAFVRVLAEQTELAASLEDGLLEGSQVFVYGFADFLDDAMLAIEQAGGKPDAAKVENFG